MAEAEADDCDGVGDLLWIRAAAAALLSAAAATSSGEEDVAGDVSVYAILNGTVSVVWRWWLRSIKQKGKRTSTGRKRFVHLLDCCSIRRGEKCQGLCE